MHTFSTYVPATCRRGSLFRWPSPHHFSQPSFVFATLADDATRSLIRFIPQTDKTVLSFVVCLLAALNPFPNEQPQLEHCDNIATSLPRCRHIRMVQVRTCSSRFDCEYYNFYSLRVPLLSVETRSVQYRCHPDISSHGHTASNLFVDAPHLPDLLCAPAQASNVGRAERKEWVRFLKPDRTHLMPSGTVHRKDTEIEARKVA